MTALSVLALNISAPTRERARGLLELLWPADDDVWVLTETSGGEGTALIAQVCRAAGHAVHVTDRSGGGGLGVMVVVRRPWLRAVEEGASRPGVLPGRVLPVGLSDRGGGGVRLLGVYGAASDPVRYSSSAQRQRKREWIQAFDGWLGGWLGAGGAAAAGTAGPAIVIGDLNLVDPVHDDALRYVLPEETALLAALEERHGLVDAWRAANPGSTEVSWVDHSGLGCRYDHAFVTPDLADRIVACDLDHEPRETGLTDHSAMRLTLDLD